MNDTSDDSFKKPSNKTTPEFSSALAFDSKDIQALCMLSAQVNDQSRRLQECVPARIYCFHQQLLAKKTDFVLLSLDSLLLSKLL